MIYQCSEFSQLLRCDINIFKNSNEVELIPNLFNLKRKNGGKMINSRFKWQLQSQEDHKAVKELNSAGYSSIVADLLVKKGVKTAEQAKEYLQPDISLIHDPLALHDMDKAVERIEQAIERGEKITIYGDYDADGITSTSLLYETLEDIGANVDYYVPNRFKDGYGPNLAAYQRLIDQGTQLIVTVDNGVSGKAVIDKVMAQGIDVVVTDHHELPKDLPDAAAIVHPRYPHSKYPFPDLSGVGVAFKLAWALTGEFPEDQLDLVAIGEIADMVDVTDENRVLISLGLQVLRQGRRPGVHQLVKLAGLDEAKITDQNIGFDIAPRLNALGRIADANDGVRLLTTFDEEEGKELASQVEKDNQKRRDLVSQITIEAMAQARSAQNSDQPVLLLLGHNWHQGVLGIVASRVQEQTGKPTIVASVNDNESVAKGSGRSRDDFNLFEALDPHRDLMTAFGGHPAACGLSFEQDKADQLRAALKEEAEKQNLDLKRQTGLSLAARLTPEKVNEQLYDDLQQLAPFGPGNEEPVFEFDDVHPQDVKTMGKQNNHLKFTLINGDQKVTVIAFNQGKIAPILLGRGGKIDIAAKISINEWNGKRNVQLMLADFKILGPVILDERTGHLLPQHFTLPGEYIVYNERLRQNIAPHVGKEHTLTPEQASQMDLTAKTITLVDLPNNLTQFQAIFANDTGTPALIRLLLAPQGMSVYSAGIPQRSHFAKVYQFLYRYRSIRWPNQARQVSRQLKISQDLLNLIIKVFSGLGFVTISSGVLKLQSPKEKVTLEQTAPYKKMVAQYQAEETLIYSDATAVTKWVLQCLKKN